MIRVFIGYDPREAVASSVLAFSIQERSSEPVSVVELRLSHGILTRERHPLQSTDFSFSRFLVPYLSGYEGWSLFMDCDMLMLDDVAKLWELRDDRYSVMVVKNYHVPEESVKFLGETQTKYEKKNWSSVMLFNNSRCGNLTPGYVNQASGLDLHQFKWLISDDLIGELPGRWNHLVGCSSAEASLVHYTLGGPYFPGYENCEYAKEWRAERDRMCAASPRGGICVTTT